MRFEWHALLAKLVGMLLPVVHLTVVTEPDTTVVVTKRLVGFRPRIHDGQACMDERYLWPAIVTVTLYIPTNHVLGIRPTAA